MNILDTTAQKATTVAYHILLNDSDAQSADTLAEYKGFPTRAAYIRDLIRKDAAKVHQVDELVEHHQVDEVHQIIDLVEGVGPLVDQEGEVFPVATYLKIRKPKTKLGKVWWGSIVDACYQLLGVCSHEEVAELVASCSGFIWGHDEAIELQDVSGVLWEAYTDKVILLE